MQVVGSSKDTHDLSHSLIAEQRAKRSAVLERVMNGRVRVLCCVCKKKKRIVHVWYRTQVLSVMGFVPIRGGCCTMCMRHRPARDASQRSSTYVQVGS